jgi:hypothetical protein
MNWNLHMNVTVLDVTVDPNPSLSALAQVIVMMVTTVLIYWLDKQNMWPAIHALILMTLLALT